jgi:phosphoglycolate phosphatase
MIKLCILDFDGTLCGTHDAIRHCINLSFDHYGVERPAPDRVDAVIAAGVVMTEAMSILMDGRLNADEAGQWAATYRAFYLEHGLAHSFLFPQAEQTLADLRKKGIAMVIASNKSEGAVKQAIDHYGIGHFIDLLVCDPAGIPKKPDPACYRTLIAPAFPGVSPEQVVVVGDTHADLGLARNIGARACWAAYGYGDPARCLQMSPEIVIHGLGELVEWLDSV